MSILFSMLVSMALANCPDFSGKWICTVENNQGTFDTEFSQIEVDGVTQYTLGLTQFLADGLSHQVGLTTYVSQCTAEGVSLQTHAPITDFEDHVIPDAFASYNYMFRLVGDTFVMTMDGTLQFPGQEDRVSTGYTCEKQNQ